MSSSLPLSISHDSLQAGTGTEVRDTSNAVLLSILKSLGINQSELEERRNGPNAKESTSVVHSRSLNSEHLDTEFLDSPNSSELQAIQELFGSLTDVPSSQLGPPKTPAAPLQQVNANSSEYEAGEGAVVRPQASGIAEYGHDIEEPANAHVLSPLAKKHIDFRTLSLPPNFSPAPSFHPPSPNTSSNEIVIKRRKKVDTKSIKKRKSSKKAHRERLVGSNTSKANDYTTRRSRKNKLSKQKDKHHLKSRKSLNNKNKKRTYDDNRVIEDSVLTDDDATVTSDSEAPAGDDLRRLTSIKDAFFAKVEKNWDKVIGLYLDGKLEDVGHRQITNMNQSNTFRYESNLVSGNLPDFRVVARAHIRNLLFPNAPNTSNASNETRSVPYGLIPWATLGIWLYLQRKRFTNWDESIPFRPGSSLISHLRVPQLKNMLLIDLVDWTKDEIKFGTIEVPLVLDTRGRVLVKVADLPRLYPGYKLRTMDSVQPVLRDSDEQSTETQSSSSTSSSSSRSSSSSSSSPGSTVPLRVKRKRRACTSSKKQIVTTNSSSDENDDSDSESEDESEGDSNYGTENSESDYRKRMVNSRMKKKSKRSY